MDTKAQLKPRKSEASRVPACKGYFYYSSVFGGKVISKSGKKERLPARFRYKKLIF
jgi:hypothetical protein